MTLYTVASGEPRHWLQALDFLVSRKRTFPFEDLISASYRLDQVNEAMQAMASYQVVKPVIDMRG
jgi:Zn-dependent alcohol dehydrogenase